MSFTEEKLNLKKKEGLSPFFLNLSNNTHEMKLQKEVKIPNAYHIPRGMLEFWLDPNSAYFKECKLDINKPMILFCAGGLRSALATKTLLEMGFEKVSHIDGGFSSMRANGFKVE